MLLFTFITSAAFIFFAVSLYNFITKPILRRLKFIHQPPKISVLIPVRNEEENILNIVKSVTDQSYPNYEIIFLDDQSEDKTLQILRRMQKQFSSMNVVEGLPLPSGWIGKNWACYQLAQIAKGDIFLFLDADVILSKYAIESALASMINAHADMLSIHSTQIMESFGEWLVVPMLNVIVLSILPLRQIYNSQRSSLAAANGQFLMITKSAYFQFGGHKTVYNQIVEDMQIARIMKIKGYRIYNLMGEDEVKCRMYTGLSDAIKGFGKNFFIGTSLPVYLFLGFISLLLLVHLYPFIAVFYDSKYLLPAVLIFLIRILNSIQSKQFFPLNLLLHPFQIIFMYFIGIYSIIGFHTKSISWKNRKLY